MLRTPASLSGYPTSTWAGLPAAASAQGQIVRVTDFGVTGVGILVISDGTRWLPLGPQMLARSSVAASVTGTTNETTLATITVPAGLMGPAGGVEVRTLWTYTNSANNKTFRARLGGAAGAQHLNATATATNAASLISKIRNRGATNSQVGGLAPGTITPTGTALVTSAIDTSVAQDIVITGQLALGTETNTLESYEVWVLP